MWLSINFNRTSQALSRASANTATALDEARAEEAAEIEKDGAAIEELDALQNLTSADELPGENTVSGLRDACDETARLPQQRRRVVWGSKGCMQNGAFAPLIILLVLTPPPWLLDSYCVNLEDFS